MAEQEPHYPIVLVIILGAVIPLLALRYVGYWISLCVNNPPDASFDTNFNVLWTFIKAIFFVVLGYFSFGIAYGFHTGWKDKIKNQRLERTFQEPSYPMPIYRESQEARESREASEAFHRKTDMYRTRHTTKGIGKTESRQASLTSRRFLFRPRDLMTDYDSDAPETLSDFLDRQMRRGPHTVIPSGLTKEERSFYGESIEEAWERLEKEKAERRRIREQELKEHERMVAQVKTQIEREKERIRRDTERLAREQQRKREQ